MIKNSNESGFTLVESLVVIAIIGVLFSLLLVGLNASREASRAVTCRSHLKNVSLGIAGYESAKGRLPPGTSGNKYAVPWEDYRNNESSPVYWKQYQHTSYLAHCLPFFEQNVVYDSIDPVFFSLDHSLRSTYYNWFGEVQGFSEACTLKVSVLECPADTLADPGFELNIAGGSQPVLNPNRGTLSFSFIEYLNDYHGGPFVGTNYLGCSGGQTGGVHPDQLRNKFKGCMSSGERITLANILDGASNTILVGETLGEIVNGNREYVQPWIVGGLAKGLGNLPWNRPPVANENVLGNAYNSSGFGFGSKHVGIVVIGFVDGSIRDVSHNIDWRLMNSLSGIADGTIKSPGGD